MNGYIKRLVEDKGYGFIKGEDGKEYFFHHSGLVDGDFVSLREKQAVRFEPGTGQRGPRAEAIELDRG